MNLNFLFPDCKRWMAGERLFDYTKQSTQVNNNAQLPNTPSHTTAREYDIQQAAKFEQSKIEGLI